jgi:hypothetical protein
MVYNISQNANQDLKLFKSRKLDVCVGVSTTNLHIGKYYSQSRIKFNHKKIKEMITGHVYYAVFAILHFKSASVGLCIVENR